MTERYVRSIRLLAECFHAFERQSGANIRCRTGLTPSQFDIVATLGNTPGMTFKELGERTLITKGTLTGVIDRLQEKGLVDRITQLEDRRSTLVKLTKQGEAEFKRVFAPQIAFGKQSFANYAEQDFEALDKELTKLHANLTGKQPKPKY
ncbi:MarR family winged helix-turn-helix transcriptional regulator [Herminiimonas fonticola]|uniref:MarR family transcriptional regulator n=1 Tax=Herminiimonas fonticola TaxID=303380 RepID=A0A4R6G3C2_9BURK|nr:MarR family transcriptional regulator [Herminiimonas fonticola]RBA23200.1 Transcriptional regulator [Herminiimonas fonticola]TDN88919.1 MarR family transcriptional regulator [Herminiimonas fonticola]